ncbi:MAG: SDR family oxidoreductase [Halioglobus sp.]
MSGNPLQQDGMNAIVVGNGAIGSALAANLLQRKNLERLVILQRGSETAFRDPRVTIARFDAEQPASVAAAAADICDSVGRIHLLINTVGLLHCDGQQPEKRLSRLDAQNLQRSFAINATLLPVLAQAFSGALRHQDAALLASLSARVGSIEDNRMGGWYSYRASKAAHNMLLKTIAHEWRLSHRNVVVAALHPGTVESRLSEPFISPSYSNRVLAPSECAEHLMQVIGGLTTESSGGFFDWQGDVVPW